MNLKTFRNPSGELLDTAFHPGTRADRLVILGHGLTGNKDRPLLVALAGALSAAGWPCLRISYAGNGLSEGRFTAATLSKEVRDLRALIAALPRETRLAYVGHSMGGAVGALTTAVEPRIATLVSLAGMVRTAAFVKREFSGITPGTGHMWDKPECPLSQEFLEQMLKPGSTLAAARLITVPWLLVHGTADDLVPDADSREAHAAAECVKRLILLEGAGHSFAEDYQPVITACQLWLETHLA